MNALIEYLISELESESARWADERRKIERGDDPNIGTAICNAKTNAYADAAFRVKRAFGIAPPDAWGFRTANAQHIMLRRRRRRCMNAVVLNLTRRQLRDIGISLSFRVEQIERDLKRMHLRRDSPTLESAQRSLLRRHRKLVSVVFDLQNARLEPEPASGDKLRADVGQSESKGG